MTWECGFSTDLLGLVVARATGQTLDAMLQTRLLDPLGAGAPGKRQHSGTGRGGDLRSHRIEANREVILGAVRLIPARVDP